jgi:hypothetical protein
LTRCDVGPSCPFDPYDILNLNLMVHDNRELHLSCTPVDLG